MVVRVKTTNLYDVHIPDYVFGKRVDSIPTAELDDFVIDYISCVSSDWEEIDTKLVDYFIVEREDKQ